MHTHTHNTSTHAQCRNATERHCAMPDAPLHRQTIKHGAMSLNGAVRKAATCSDALMGAGARAWVLVCVVVCARTLLVPAVRERSLCELPACVHQHPPTPPSACTLLVPALRERSLCELPVCVHLHPSTPSECPWPGTAPPSLGPTRSAWPTPRPGCPPRCASSWGTGIYTPAYIDCGGRRPGGVVSSGWGRMARSNARVGTAWPGAHSWSTPPSASALT